MQNPITPQNLGVHELIHLLQNINTWRVGSNPNHFEIQKFGLIEIFLKSENSEVINVEDFINIIKSAKFNEDSSKSTAIKDFLISERSSNVSPQDLANMIKEVGLKNRADLSIELYTTKFSSSENYI